VQLLQNRRVSDSEMIYQSVCWQNLNYQFTYNFYLFILHMQISAVENSLVHHFPEWKGLVVVSLCVCVCVCVYKKG